MAKKSTKAGKKKSEANLKPETKKSGMHMMNGKMMKDSSMKKMGKK